MLRFLRHSSRETIIAVIAGVMLVFTGWAWGGVVLWTQFVTCGLGALALLVALTPRDSASLFRMSANRGYLWSLLLGAIVGSCVAAYDWMQVDNIRTATLQLLPDAQLPELAIVDWATRGALVAAALSLVGMFTSALRMPTHARSVLLRFPPFWIGAALFGYIAVQSLNPWGLVVERDLTWKIIPQDYITWLPAGLDAPFIGDRDPGGMNGWRQMLILSGPWMLLCALRIAVQSRQTLTRLAWVVVLNAVAIAVVGNMVYASKAREFLGYKPWYSNYTLFGPFVNKNHAGIYLYLAAGLALALTLRLIVHRGDRADRGGPHLLAAFLYVMLCFAAASTVSIGAIGAAACLLLAAPVLYFAAPKLREALSPVPALIFLGLSLVLGYVTVSSTNLGIYRYRLSQKKALLERTGLDDRAPMRSAGIAQAESGGAAKALFGWGAGSYRWVAPQYLAKQPEFLDASGRLWKRPNFMHCDWLQAFLEWGLAGWVMVAFATGWLALLIRNAWRKRSAQLLALSVALGLVLVHATVDFIFYFTPVLTLVALMVAWLSSADEDRVDGRGGNVLRPPSDEAARTRS